MLLLTFTTVLIAKDFHFHTYSIVETEQANTSHHASIGENCYICNFVMHESVAIKVAAFIPVITVTLVHFLTFSPQIVYRHVGSINAHAPPTMG